MKIISIFMKALKFFGAFFSSRKKTPPQTVVASSDNSSAKPETIPANPKPYKELITLADWAMGRDIKYPREYTPTIKTNANDLLKRVNDLLNELEIEKAVVTSGWRPAAVNRAAGGARKSSHMVGKAVDILDDTEQSLANKILSRPELLKKYDLWIEDPNYTIGKRTNWVHLDTKQRSKRVVNKFIP